MSEYWKDKNKIKLNLQKIVNDYENKLKAYDFFNGYYLFTVVNQP